MDRSAWIPESPTIPGVYANASDNYEPGKIKTGIKQPSTMDADKARQLPTREECQAWCEANPHPVFVPVEHGWFSPAARAVLAGKGGE